MHDNTQRMIDFFSCKTELDGRFTNLECRNVDGGIKRGYFSTVFSASDKFNETPVALKFLDPSSNLDKYRIDCFEREPNILAKLEGKKRCLQLKQAMQSTNWEVDAANGQASVPIPSKYFATEWLEHDVDDYFLGRQEKTAREKLEIFRKIVLAVQAVHRHDIHHRDIKSDNIRQKFEDGENSPVLIDFGTAAHTETANIFEDYPFPAGAIAYSPPEAAVGFAGERQYGSLADSYALGCLLYELFNRGYFYTERDETDYEKLVRILKSDLCVANSCEKRKAIWIKRIRGFRNVRTKPDFLGLHHTVPAAISELLVRCYESLVEFDFLMRARDLSNILRLTDSAIKVLQNKLSAQRKLAYKRKLRQLQADKIRRKSQRLEEYLLSEGVNHAKP